MDFIKNKSWGNETIPLQPPRRRRVWRILCGNSRPPAETRIMKMMTDLHIGRDFPTISG